LLDIEVVINGAEIVVLSVVDGIEDPPAESIVLVLVGEVVGSSVRPGGGVTFSVLGNGL